jgi:hypothetical protein
MAVKSKVKPEAKVKSKSVVRAKVAKKLTSKPGIKVEASRSSMIKQEEKLKALPRAADKLAANDGAVVEKVSSKPAAKPGAAVVKRVVAPLLEKRRPIKRAPRVNQFAFMKAPGYQLAFEVGDTVEVFCDHEKNRERIRGWVKGIVVQVDHKMVAVQFRSNVYLTDGWMVPDRILWYPVNSEHIRAVAGKKPLKEKKDFIPDY